MRTQSELDSATLNTKIRQQQPSLLDSTQVGEASYRREESEESEEMEYTDSMQGSGLFSRRTLTYSPRTQLTHSFLEGKKLPQTAGDPARV